MHQWAEAERHVPIGTTPEPGPWRSKPYQRPVLEAISDPTTQGVVYIAASQGGAKTEVILNAAGYFIAHDPSPILVVSASLELAEAFSKDRLAPTIKESPALAALVKDSRSRDSGNTIRHKEFPGGHITIVGANSASGLASRPIRVVLFDEVDRYPASAGTEGDPVKLAETRTSAFWNAVKVAATSPGYREGRSWALWEKSDQSEFYVPCGDCGTEQVLKWSHVHWEKSETGEHLPQTASYVCEQCGAAWDDTARWRAIRKGAYKATAPGKSWRGFRVPAMAVLGRKLAPMVEQWLDAQGNPEQLKVFVNTVLAEWWDDEQHQKTLDPTGFMREGRREPIHAVPPQCALITAGVDIQDNRFEASVYAWGHGEESWLLTHEEILGDPSAAAIWDALDEFLRQPWPRAAGGVDYIRGTCIDTGGHYTQAAYDFCAPRFRLPTPDGGRAFVFAIKGTPGTGDLWPRTHSRIVKKVPLWPLRVDAGKEQVYGRLSLAEPGPGYVHFPDTLESRFFEGLTSEKLVTTTNRKGFPVRTWKPKRDGQPNEPLDCAVYAYAALCGLRAMGYDLERAIERLAVRPVFEPSASVPRPSVAPQPAPPPVAVAQRSAPKRPWIDQRRNWLRR